MSAGRPRYYRETRNFRFPVSRTEKTGGIGEGTFVYRSIPDGEVSATIEVEIDLDAIFEELGRRAALSKGRRSQDGHVKVRAHGVCKVVDSLEVAS